MDVSQLVVGKRPDAEKITINVGFVDLGQIDLLVEDGFFANRTDFIRTAIRNQLGRHDEVVKKAITRRRLELGLVRYERAELERIAAAGEMLELDVLGLASIADDVSPDLARRTIASLKILGAFHAPAPVKAALRDRMR